MNEDDVDASLESFARGGDTNAIRTVASNVIQRVYARRRSVNDDDVRSMIQILQVSALTFGIKTLGRLCSVMN